MKKIILILLIAGSILAQEIVELKLPSSNKVVIDLRFQNGSISDPAGKEGLTYFTANLVTQGGTDKMSFSEIQDFIYPMAASYYVNVDKEVTTFSFAVHVDFLDQFSPIIMDLMLHPSFNENDFQRVKTNQQNYVDQVIRASSDEEYSKMALEDLLFRGSNYQHMKQGMSESVNSITLEDVKSHYKNFFTKNNLMIGIAGNYSDDFLTKLKSGLGKLSDVKPVIPKPGKALTPDGLQFEIIQKDNAFGSAIFAGFPLNITREDDDFAAMVVANSYLGEHRKSYSKLYKLLRETRSMNYGDYSYIEWYDNGGGNMLPPSGTPRSSNYFAIWIRPVQIAKQLTQQYEELKDLEVGHAHFAFRMALMEIDRLIKDGLTEEEFEATRDFLLSYTKLYAQSPSSRLGYLMDSRFYGRQDYISELDGLLKKLTLNDVNNAIKKYWQTENMFVTIITDKSEAGPLAASIKENKPSPMSYSNLVKEGLPEDVLKEDEAAANMKLNVKKVEIINSADTFKKEEKKVDL
ncbi:MAG: insulinase family protein [Ignavibacteriales bacterium]|nr:insulinase family protein [Ignavibacteriales bacterium]